MNIAAKLKSRLYKVDPNSKIFYSNLLPLLIRTTPALRRPVSNGDNRVV